jgi:hypothetical protein
MSSTADDGKPCPGCARDLVNGECQTDGCPGPATEADDTSASSLMGDSTNTQPTEPQGEVFDPAEQSDPHRDGMMQAAADAVSSSLVSDDEDLVWHELDEEERKARMRQTEIDGDQVVEEHSSNPDAVAEPAALDWHAFARRFKFHLAGQGVQSRFTTKHKVVTALSVDDAVGAGAESFFHDAIEHADVPLDIDQTTGRVLFRSEVLADE